MQETETTAETQATKEKTPYLFVVGCPRSGTTLLQRMLDHHPQLAVANDTHFIPKCVEDVGIGTDPPISDELVKRVQNYRRFKRLGLTEDMVERAAGMARKYSEFVSVLYSEFGKIHQKPLAGEKTPDYVKHLPRLHALFPWVKSIHIIRDGRDVALSTLQWAQEDKGPGRYSLWGKEPVAVCALWWKRQVASGRKDGRELGKKVYSEILYEDLVAHPEQMLRGLLTFLDLDFASQMLTFYEGKTRTDPGLSAKSAWLPPTQGLRDWRTQMAERDVELFEALAGDLLSLLGYERRFSTISPQITKLAEKCQKWWEEEMARRRKKSKKA